ncbi:sensor histidine kinase [Streptomyces sp. NPDC127084]|uniref:sensor histidine kinase n=1 Tax=Streptomyces sp. NPDC127084 TaxID=3347133 RepID=UPI00365B42C5
MELFVFPPQAHPRIALAIVLVYGLWGVAALIVPLDWAPHAFMVWMPLIDFCIMTAFLAVSGGFSDPSWSSPVALDVFMLIPLLAAFSFNPLASAVTGILCSVTYIAGIGIGHMGNTPWDWASTHALFILVLASGSILLSNIQQRRVRLIGKLDLHRSRLLAMVMSAEERERNDLAEALHDGAVQNVLAARHEVEEAQSRCASEALARADVLLKEVASQLRSSIKVLHSEVLETRGLAHSLVELTEQLQLRTDLSIHVDCHLNSAGVADRLLYRAAREFLINIEKHAHAKHVWISLKLNSSEIVELQISDDGVGIQKERLEEKISAGHLGLESQRSRIEGAGGRLFITANASRGTTARVLLPVAPGQCSS